MTKRIVSLALAVLLVLGCFSFCFADGEKYTQKYWRVTDFTALLVSDPDIEALEDLIVENIEASECDYPVFITDEIPGGESSSSYLDWLYESSGFGYGEDLDGVAMLVETEAQKVSIRAYGASVKKFMSADYLDTIADIMVEFFFDGENEMADVIAAYVGTIAEDVSAAKTAGARPSSDAGKTGRSYDMPYWYPEDINSFSDFHDYAAPRVVDDADIFTPEEEARMLDIISSIQDDSKMDIVVFTDVSSYGLSHGVYAADFHHFNGYGFGDDYSGTVMLICMEEGNRGWWTAATGRCRDIYTESVINQLDDRLEPYMLDGDYGEGVINYLRDVRELYRLPDWYPEDADSFERFHNSPGEPRVIDETGVLSSAQKQELEQRIAKIRDESGADILIYITDHCYFGQSIKRCGEDRFLYGGYGEGSGYDGGILAICDQNASIAAADVAFSGDRPYYGQETSDRISEKLKKPVAAHDFYKTACIYLDSIEYTYAKGRAPKTYHLGMPLIASLVIGAVAAFVRTGIMKSKMKTVRAASRAENYVVSGSFELKRSQDIYLGSSISKTARPKKESKGGGGSSFSGGYSSSGGRSYSGGGRKF